MKSPSVSRNWMMVAQRIDAPAARVICLPYAGGSAAAYGNWHRCMPSDVEVCAVELPGRGGRFKEAALASMDGIVDHVMALCEAYLDLPFVLFGHSMGGVIALELLKRLCAIDARPAALLVSGCRAPHLPSRRPARLFDLPKDALIRELSLLEGLPRSLLEVPGLIDTFLPTIRADLQCREEWSPEVREIDLPIHALGGEGDKLVQASDLAAWQSHSSMPLSIKMFEGGHFFIRDKERQVVEHLAQVVRVSVREPGHRIVK